MATMGSHGEIGQRGEGAYLLSFAIRITAVVDVPR